jgi:hypothetical protein
MRKMILTLVLAIASSVWMANEASNWCMPSVRTFTEPWIEVNGIFQAEGIPCEPGEICPPCLTIVLVTSNKTYYLVTDDGQLIDQLDTIPLGTKATVSGIPFEHGSYDYLQVSHIETDQILPSFCDEWNILEISNATCGGCEAYRTLTSRLTTDTVINEIVYTRLIEDGMYKGAIRQGNNIDIYYIPAGSTHEYLLYAFNARVGDVLSNLWIGRIASDNPDGWTMTVEEKRETNPRTFILSTGFTNPEEGLEVFPLYITWIEGVGLPDGPVGSKRYDGYADSRGQVVLCAYKNGEQIYVSDMGEQYGCVYNYDPYATPTDTIPLFSYTGDDPGSSTVDPVDPNQVVVTLNGDQLTIREHTGSDITYSLNHNAPAKKPAQSQTSASDTFRNEITLQITESGEYQLLLTNPSWDYSIYGTFFYSPQGIESVHSTSVPQKVLQNGQFYILRNGKVYTITGQKLK